MKILITGAQGYIGTRLIQICMSSKMNILATDIGFFKNCTLHNYIDPIDIHFSDLRKFDFEILRGVDCVIHLGALSNDPLGDFDDKITLDINYKSTIELAENAKKFGVRRFIFSSSCIMYGSSKTEIVDESSDLDPKTAYAISKVKAENDLKNLASDNFSPIFVRNGTIFGYSPRMRIDTVLNSFLFSILIDNKIKILGNGSPWRPVVHIDDVCRSLIMLTTVERELIHNQAFNNGSNELNVTIKSLAEGVTEILNAEPIHILNSEDADQRTYKASFDKFNKFFPKFKFNKTPINSSKEVFEQFTQNKDDLIKNKNNFIRLNYLKKLIEEDKLNKHLFLS